MRLTIPVDKGLPKNLLFSGILQIVLLAGSMITFDCGESSKRIMGSIAIFWLAMIWIAMRRRNCPSRGDLIFAKYGFLFILFASGFALAFREWIRFRFSV
jgi:hypothetical protein